MIIKDLKLDDKNSSSNPSAAYVDMKGYWTTIKEFTPFSETVTVKVNGSGGGASSPINMYIIPEDKIPKNQTQNEEPEEDVEIISLREEDP